MRHLVSFLSNEKMRTWKPKPKKKRMEAISREGLFWSHKTLFNSVIYLVGLSASRSKYSKHTNKKIQTYTDMQ